MASSPCRFPQHVCNCAQRRVRRILEARTFLFTWPYTLHLGAVIVHHQAMRQLSSYTGNYASYNELIASGQSGHAAVKSLPASCISTYVDAFTYASCWMEEGWSSCRHCACIHDFQGVQTAETGSRLKLDVLTSLECKLHWTCP